MTNAGKESHPPPATKNNPLNDDNEDYGSSEDDEFDPGENFHKKS